MGKNRSGKSFYEMIEGSSKGSDKVHFSRLNLPTVRDKVPDDFVLEEHEETGQEEIEVHEDQHVNEEQSHEDAQRVEDHLTEGHDEPVPLQEGKFGPVNPTIPIEPQEYESLASNINDDDDDKVMTNEELLKIANSLEFSEISHHQRLRKKKFSQLHVYTADLAGYLGLMNSNQLDGLFEKGYSEEKINHLLNTLYLKKKKTSSNPRFSKKSFYSALKEVGGGNRQPEPEQTMDSQLKDFVDTEYSDLSEEEYEASDEEKENVFPDSEANIRQIFKSPQQLDSNDDSDRSSEDSEDEKDRFKKRLKGVLPYSFVRVPGPKASTTNKRGPVTEKPRVGLARKKMSKPGARPLNENVESFVADDDVLEESDAEISPYNQSFANISGEELSDAVSISDGLSEPGSGYGSETEKYIFNEYFDNQSAFEPKPFHHEVKYEAPSADVNKLYEDTGLNMFGASKESFMSGFTMMLSRDASKKSSRFSKPRSTKTRDQNSSHKAPRRHRPAYGPGPVTGGKRTYSKLKNINIKARTKQGRIATSRKNNPTSSSSRRILSNNNGQIEGSGFAKVSTSKRPKLRTKHASQKRYADSMFDYGRSPYAATLQIEVLASETPWSKKTRQRMTTVRTEKTDPENEPVVEPQDDFKITKVVNLQPTTEEYSGFKMPDNSATSQLDKWLNVDSYVLIGDDELGFTVPVINNGELDLFYSRDAHALPAIQKKLIRDVSEMLNRSTSNPDLLSLRSLSIKMIDWATNMLHNRTEYTYLKSAVSEIISQFLARPKKSDSLMNVFAIPYLLALHKSCAAALKKSNVELSKEESSMAGDLQDQYTRLLLRSNYSWHLSSLYDNESGCYMYESFGLFCSLLDEHFYKQLASTRLQNKDISWWKSLAHFLRLSGCLFGNVTKRVLEIFCDLFVQSPLLHLKEANTTLSLLVRDLVTNHQVDFSEKLMVNLYKVIAARKFIPLDGDTSDRIQWHRPHDEISASDSSTTTYLKLLVLFSKSGQTVSTNRLIEKLMPMGSILQSDPKVFVARLNVLFTMQDVFHKDLTQRFNPIVDALFQTEGPKYLPLGGDLIWCLLNLASPPWGILVRSSKLMVERTVSEYSPSLLMKKRNSAVIEHLILLIKRLDSFVLTNDTAVLSIRVLDIFNEILMHPILWSAIEECVPLYSGILTKVLQADSVNLEFTLRNTLKGLGTVVIAISEGTVDASADFISRFLHLWIQVWKGLSCDWQTIKMIYWPYFGSERFRKSAELYLYISILEQDKNAYESDRNFFQSTLFRCMAKYRCDGLFKYYAQLSKVAVQDPFLKFPLYVESATRDATRFDHLRSHLLNSMVENISTLLRVPKYHKHAKEMLEVLLESLDESYEDVMYDGPALVTYKPFVKAVVASINLQAFHSLRTNNHLVHLNDYMGISNYGEIEDSFVEKLLTSPNLQDMTTYLIDEYFTSVRHRSVVEFEEKLRTALLRCPAIFGDPDLSLSKLYPLCTIIVAVSLAVKKENKVWRVMNEWMSFLCGILKEMELVRADVFCLLKLVFSMSPIDTSTYAASQTEKLQTSVGIYEVLIRSATLLKGFDDEKQFRESFDEFLSEGPEHHLRQTTSFTETDIEKTLAEKMKKACETLEFRRDDTFGENFEDLELLRAKVSNNVTKLSSIVSSQPSETTAMNNDINVQ
ncbi:unnamed protein product [Kuraishia capsulata CBS 1993]|uniref:Uncharacterized protein n=1 Tax=Kuraishia capsulata CBS 1993 TaxID=1382522 RepID=W6MPU8_9ASCO|nr:uncharacterized protein KUCA_T00003185001 [Kuraishia capsulata CBS 1993]CDK27207.1 unnamed protein product [Kuraishia capsulata CBS 1993]